MLSALLRIGLQSYFGLTVGSLDSAMPSAASRLIRKDGMTFILKESEAANQVNVIASKQTAAADGRCRFVFPTDF